MQVLMLAKNVGAVAKFRVIWVAHGAAESSDLRCTVESVRAQIHTVQMCRKHDILPTHKPQQHDRI